MIPVFARFFLRRSCHSSVLVSTRFRHFSMKYARLYTPNANTIEYKVVASSVLVRSGPRNCISHREYILKLLCCGLDLVSDDLVLLLITNKLVGL
jgi:hypothetical protein